MPKKGSKNTVCNCGHVNKKSASLKEKIKQTSQNIEVVNKETETLPTIEADCSKCESKEAYYWTMQTRAADEAETKFLRCEKCHHVWREYD